MNNQKPLTPEDFVRKNLPIVKKVFPTLVTEETKSDPGVFTNPEGVKDFIAGVENQVWDTMGNDPVMQRLDRKGYDALPEHQRLKILEDSIRMLDAAREADKFIKGSQ